MSLLLFGHGYLGSRVASLWQAHNKPVMVVTRSIAKAQQLQRQGIETVVADVTRDNLAGKLPSPETVLFAIGYDRGSSDSVQRVYAAAMRNVLAALPDTTERVIYISSTGVYGPSDQEWVDEMTPGNPQRDGGHASLAAENILRASTWRDRAIILRLAGIYGPGRIPRRNDLLAGKPIDAPVQGWLNLIHVNDAARVVGAMESQRGPDIFNVSDGAPCERRDYYITLARLLGAPEPKFVEPEPNSPAYARAQSSRRISNAHLREKTQYEFLYPNYIAGLTGIIAAEAAP